MNLVKNDDFVKNMVINDSTDKQNGIIEIEKRLKDAMTNFITSFKASIPQEISNWYNGLTSTDSDENRINKMAEIIYNDLKGGATSEHSQGEKSPTKRQQTSDQHDGTMGGTTDGQHGVVPSGIPSGEQGQEGIQGLGDAPTSDSGERVSIDKEGDEPQAGTRGERPDKSGVETVGGKGERPGEGSNTDGNASESGGNRYPVLTNYRIDSSDAIFTSGGKKSRFKANVSAIENHA